MRAIETKAVVSPNGTLTARVPADIQPGEHQVVLVIEEKPVKAKKFLYIYLSISAVLGQTISH